MSGTYEQILLLIERDSIVVSDHGYDELAADGIFVKDVLSPKADNPRQFSSPPIDPI